MSRSTPTRPRSTSSAAPKGKGATATTKVQRTRQATAQPTFEDQGPGIPDVALALSDGYTTGHGMGLGLGGARRLVNEFEIVSAPGQGTRVTITRWK